jgi:hypothetical protein
MAESWKKKSLGISLAILLLSAILPFGEEALIYKWQPRNLCLSPILSTLGIPCLGMPQVQRSF